MNGDSHAGIHLPECLGGDVQPGKDAGGLGEDHRAGLLLRVDDALGRHVTPAEVLRQRAPNQLTIDTGIERFERDSLHGCVSEPPGSSDGSTET